MRIVLDTNILARAVTGPDGPAAEVLRGLIAPHRLILSPFLLSELIRVLGYERLRPRHGLDDAGIARYVAQLHAQSLIIEPPAEAIGQAILHDPQDDPNLATAIIGRADVLCTLDRDFRHPAVLAICAAHSLRVLSDVELLRELRSEEGAD